jgi:septal ring factor EnvC (AmiA/AmiB activator)
VAAARPAPRPGASPDDAAPVASTPIEPPRAEPLPAAPDRPVSLSGSFRANRGRLPWPADGTVTGRFGTRTDPVYGTRVDAPGIDITTAPGAGVRAVFEGTVDAINVMPTFGTFVMVSHGGYHTFYANLSSVAVRQGQRVRAGQVIGRAGTSEQSRGPGLFFAIFEGERQVDPAPWLR